MTPTNNPHYDVIIIGSGSVGTPIAFYLAKAGYKPLVVDSASSVGQGSNKKAIGGIRATHSDPAKIQLCQRSLEIFSTWRETYGDDIEWYKGGYAYVAYREREKNILKETLHTQQKYQLNNDWYGTDDLLKIVPDLNPEGLIGGTFSPDDGSASPLLAVHAFYTHALEMGAEFLFNQPVTGLVIRSGKVIGVQTNQGTYEADIVINTSGPWAAQIGKMAGVDLPVRPDSHESAITEPVARFFDPMVVDIRPAPGSANFYFYQHITGQIIFCITPSPNVWGFDSRETSGFLPMIADRMLEVMPRLRNIRVRRTWRGLYPMTPDGYPIVDWTREVGGFLQVVGLCGQGFMLGPGLAELVVRMVENRLTSRDQETLKYISLYREFNKEEMLK
jgi:sarcosine oxidase subunit beta